MVLNFKLFEDFIEKIKWVNIILQFPVLLIELSPLIATCSKSFLQNTTGYFMTKKICLSLLAGLITFECAQFQIFLSLRKSPKKL